MKNVEDVYRLSPTQRELLSHRPASPETWPEHLLWSLRGPLDEPALEAALAALVRRHTALRVAIFSEKLQEPVQVVREKLEPRLVRQDLSGLPEEEHPARLEAYLAAERERGLSLAAAPLLRLTLLRTGPESGWLVLGYHPLILDPASAFLCLKDLLQLYKAAREGTEADLEKPPAYREYLAWLEQQDLGAAESWFRQSLRGARSQALRVRSTPAEVPVGHSPYLPHRLVLSPAATESVQGLMRQHKLSLATLLQAAWALVLRAHAGEDTLFGVLVSGRPTSLPRSEALVGRFAHLLPRRIAIPAEGPLLPWLREVQAGLAETRRHEHVTAPQVRAWLEQSPGEPLLQSAVAVDVPTEEDASRALARELGFSSASLVPASAPAPLLVSAVPGARLALHLLHDVRSFTPATVADLAGRLGALLEAMSAHPQQTMSALLAHAGTSRLTPEHAARPAVTAGAGIGTADIEAVLGQHPEVRAVSVRASPEGGWVAQVVPAAGTQAVARKAPLRFGLFYFADEADGAGDKYRVYLEGARFADRNDFCAVWTPERHFHAHGGLYPNPSVLSAALATITERINLRAGSVVLPLHHPFRIAEEWAIVDNLSRGRAAISVTSGWVPNDFSFAPDHYAQKRDVMFRTLEQVQQLWRGGTLEVKDGVGKPVELRVFPRPVQPELPIWLTCSGSPDLFVKAGEMGVNVLTSLLQQSLEDATQKIALYREARAKAGHDPAAGVVTMMLHTYVGTEPDEVLERVRGPLTAYLRSHVDLMRTLVKSLDMQVDINEPKWLDSLASFAFERYYRSSALIGTPSSCLGMVEKLVAAGADEVACFVDFGLGDQTVLSGLEHLATLRRLVEDDALRTTHLLSEYLAERLPSRRPPVSLRLVEAIRDWGHGGP